MRQILTALLLLTAAVTPLSAREVLIIGIAGGSGSGKSTLAATLAQAIGDEVIVMQQDAYYKDLSHLSLQQRKAINFDHPNSIDFEALIRDLSVLHIGNPIEQPLYDFTVSSRRDETLHLEPRSVVIVEGMLLLAMPEVRDLLDIKIFVDADADIRLVRRIRRDIEERGRTVEGVLKQYVETVHPMYWEFIEPSKRFADLIVLNGGDSSPAAELIIARLKEHVSRQIVN